MKVCDKPIGWLFITILLLLYSSPLCFCSNQFFYTKTSVHPCVCSNNQLVISLQPNSSWIRNFRINLPFVIVSIICNLLVAGIIYNSHVLSLRVLAFIHHESDKSKKSWKKVKFKIDENLYCAFLIRDGCERSAQNNFG